MALWAGRDQEAIVRSRPRPRLRGRASEKDGWGDVNGCSPTTGAGDRVNRVGLEVRTIRRGWIVRRCSSGLGARVGGHGIARASEHRDDLLHRQFFVLEGHGQAVLIHVGLDGIDVLDFFDGRTGPRGGAASDDARGLEHVGDGLGGSGRRETGNESQSEEGNDESAHGEPP